MPVARIDGLCGEADLAALLASSGLAEARKIRADLLGQPLDEFPPEPGEGCVAVDEKPNPFGSPAAADAYLRGPLVPVVIPASAPWQQHAAYVTTRAFRAVSQVGTGACPSLTVLGRGDGLGSAERAGLTDVCLRGRRPLAMIAPVDGITRFLALDSDDCYASVAIVAFSFQHVAIAVATGSAVAVGTHHAALIRRASGPWILARDLPVLPLLPSSVAAPAASLGRGGPRPDALFPEWGNQILLSGVVMGGVEAAYQPDCWPCDGAASYIAVAAGGTVVRAHTGRRLNHPHEIQALLVSALRRGGKIPGLVVARHELAAHRLLHHLRQSGIALTPTFARSLTMKPSCTASPAVPSQPRGAAGWPRRTAGHAQPAPAGSRPPDAHGQFCGLFAVDVAGFTNPCRDEHVQLYVREKMYRILECAFDGAGILWSSCRHEDRGDGVLVVVPPVTPVDGLADPLPERLCGLIRVHNRLSSEDARIQLRAAAHVGRVYHDGHGFAGDAASHLFRLLDAPRLKQLLAAADSDLAFIASEDFYRTVICRHPTLVDPAAFQRVAVDLKHATAAGWAQLLGAGGASRPARIVPLDRSA